MSENTRTNTWLMPAVFTLMALLVMYWQLLPLQTVPYTFPGPDLLLVLCTVWMLRRPDFVPVLLIATILLLADFLFLRPPGLMTIIVILVCETLRRRAYNDPDMIFSMEWLTAAGALTSIMLINRVAGALFLIDQPPLGPVLIQLIVSILVYPFLAGFCILFLGLRRIRPHERDIT